MHSVGLAPSQPRKTEKPLGSAAARSIMDCKGGAQATKKRVVAAMPPKRASAREAPPPPPPMEPPPAPSSKRQRQAATSTIPDKSAKDLRANYQFVQQVVGACGIPWNIRPCRSLAVDPNRSSISRLTGLAARAVPLFSMTPSVQPRPRPSPQSCQNRPPKPRLRPKRPQPTRSPCTAPLPTGPLSPRIPRRGNKLQRVGRRVPRQRL